MLNPTPAMFIANTAQANFIFVLRIHPRHLVLFHIISYIIICPPATFSPIMLFYYAACGLATTLIGVKLTEGRLILKNR